MKKSKSSKPTETKKDNSVGLSEVKGIVQQALKALPLAKAIEKKQMKKGYKWITKGKTSRLVSPKRLKEYLKEDWHIAIQKNYEED